MTDADREPLRHLPLLTEALGRIAFAASAAGLVGGAAGIVFRQEGAIGAGFAFTLIALILGGIMLATARRQRLWLAGMVGGDRFVHWTYEDDDWRRHIDAERRRSSEKPMRFGLLCGIGLGIVTSILVVTVNAFSTRKKLETDDLILGVGLLMLMSIVICTAFAGIFALKDIVLHRQLRRSGAHVYLGRQGLYYGGQAWPSNGSNPRFLRLDLEAGTPSLLLFAYRIKASRGGSYDKEIRVPIPTGRDAEARDVVAQIRATWQSPT